MKNDTNILTKEKVDRWLDLKFSNDFMFTHVLRSKELLKEFVNTLLSLNINDIEKLEFQKVIDEGYFSKSVRLDVYFKSNNKVINIEMQVVEKDELPMRVRYYHDIIDKCILNKGVDYDNLNESYIVFICCYDAFKLNKPRYFFETYDKENNVSLNDKRYSIIFNTNAYENVKNKELRELLKYIDGNSDKPKTRLVKKLDKKLLEVKENEILEGEFMKQIADERDLIKKSRAEGRIENSIEIAKNLLNKLNDEEISLATGLSILEIQKLRNENN